MEQKSEILKTDETSKTDEIHIKCPYCNEKQLTLISVTVCEANNSLWYKCSVNKTCKLFQIKNI
jgi:hypothetical protein